MNETPTPDQDQRLLDADKLDEMRYTVDYFEKGKIPRLSPLTFFVFTVSLLASHDALTERLAASEARPLRETDEEAFKRGFQATQAQPSERERELVGAIMALCPWVKTQPFVLDGNPCCARLVKALAA
jgi:hypothetical protein